jgi:hypothetical protein
MAWYNEPRRHALSAKGIKTAVDGKPVKKVMAEHELEYEENKELSFTPERINELWSLGKVFYHNGKEYVIGKLSTGEFYAETKKQYEKGEKAGFSSDAIFLEQKRKINQYGYPQIYYGE